MENSTHLLEFSVTNYRSIRDTTTLSLVAGKSRKNTFTLKDLNTTLLKSAVIFGANASGKSNLIRGLYFMGGVVIGRVKPYRESAQETDPQPFIFDKESHHKPTIFEIHLVHDRDLYTYKIEFDNRAKVIAAEHLRVRYRNTPSLVTIYERTSHDSVTISRNSPVRVHGISQQFGDLLESTTPFVTTLSRLARRTVAHSFVEAIQACSVVNTLAHEYTEILKPMINEVANETSNSAKETLINFLMLADTSIVDLQFKSIHGEEEIYITHQYKMGDKIAHHELPLHEESEGTRKIVEMTAPILLSLVLGRPLIVDELDSKLHPVLLRYIVELFHRSDTPAQLIMTSHDASLMDDKPGLSKDQIYFIERNSDKSSELYSLADFPEITNATRNLAQKYLSGVFGANPNIVEQHL